jgi:hypothetical protein
MIVDCQPRCRCGTVASRKAGATPAGSAARPIIGSGGARPGRRLLLEADAKAEEAGGKGDAGGEDDDDHANDSRAFVTALHHEV